MKHENECQPITSIMRKYYLRMREQSKQYFHENKENINRNLRDKKK